MAKSLILHVPLAPSPSTKSKQSFDDKSLSSTSPPQLSTHSEYYTPEMNSHNNRLSSHSDSLSSDTTSTEESNESGSPLPTRIRFHLPITPTSESPSTSASKVDIKIIPASTDDELNVSTITPKNQNVKIDDRRKTKKPKSSGRKRDKLRAIFHKQLHRTSSGSVSSTSSNENLDEWHSKIVETLSSMQQDIHGMIDGLDELPESSTNVQISSDLPNDILKAPHISFRERQRAKIELMRMAWMLNPPNLLTYDAKQSPYPYTDIVEPYHFNIHQKSGGVPEENLLVQHKPYRHRKLRYRTQRTIIRLKQNFKQLKRDFYGKDRAQTDLELPSLYVKNYRRQLEKVLDDVRTQMAEYDRINRVMSNKSSHHETISQNRKSISQVIMEMKTMDLSGKQGIEDYRAKLTPIEYISKKKDHELISSPFVPRRVRRDQQQVKKSNEIVCNDPRFDLTTFPDLKHEVDQLFGPEVPFWNRSSSPESSPRSDHTSNQPQTPHKFALLPSVIGACPLKTTDQPTINICEDEFFDAEMVPQKSLSSESNLSDPNELESVEF